MPNRVLTDRFLKSLPPTPAGKRYIEFAGAVPGSGVRVTDKKRVEPDAPGRSRAASPSSWRRAWAPGAPIGPCRARRGAADWRGCPMSAYPCDSGLYGAGQVLPAQRHERTHALHKGCEDSAGYSREFPATPPPSEKAMAYRDRTGESHQTRRRFGSPILCFGLDGGDGAGRAAGGQACRPAGRPCQGNSSPI
jgi:hypothetical protein